MTLRFRLSAVFILLLSACVQAPPPQTSYRDAAVPISIITRGGAEAMTGPWFVRGAYPAHANIHTVSFLKGRGGVAAVEFLQSGCDTSGNCEAVSDTWAAESLGHNRWRLTSDSADGPIEMWVIWIDDGLRTAAVGTPDGSYAYILDRKATGGQDRMTAAREILEFNGYNISALAMR